MASLVLDGQPCLPVSRHWRQSRSAQGMCSVSCERARSSRSCSRPDSALANPSNHSLYLRRRLPQLRGRWASTKRTGRSYSLPKSVLQVAEFTASSGPQPSNSTEKPVVARRIATTHFPLVTAMDIHSDGQRAIVATYGLAFEYLRSPAETWAQAFAREPGPVITPFRRQGESVCYCTEGTTLYFTSEKRPTPLFELSGETP